ARSSPTSRSTTATSRASWRWCVNKPTDPFSRFLFRLVTDPITAEDRADARELVEEEGYLWAKLRLSLAAHQARAVAARMNPEGRGWALKQAAQYERTFAAIEQME